MSSGKNSGKDTEAAELQQMMEFRQLILGENNQLVRDTVEEHARDIVSNVLTEALHDRQNADGTVSQVLTPLVEKSVEESVAGRREQFVSYLYPLVGSLVRKSVSSFIAGLMEQTNELLESSLTYKGLKWRFKAWQAGVSYSQYVVSQTFLFRVEQILLIHRETGLLLKTVIRDKTQTADGDMVSAMLTAINDFVSDSFSSEGDANEQSLDEVKTDDFTLLIKQGPQALLVAAVTGNAPANVGDRLQLTLENIHRIYGEELKAFDGDAVHFENTEQQLNDCLLAQQKESQTKRRKVPWMAILLSLSIFSVCGYFLVKQWQLDYKAQQVQQLSTVPGIILLKAERCDASICVEVLRDPIAQQSMSWLEEAGVSPDAIKLTERAYRSLDPELIPIRLQELVNTFPELVYQEAETKFYGELSGERFRQFRERVVALPDKPAVAHLLSGITVAQAVVSDSQLNQFLLEQNVAELEKASISFNSNESNLRQSELIAVKKLSEKIMAITEIAQKLEQNIQVIVMGATDPIGSNKYNQKLSAKRADAVREELIKQGVNPNVVKAVGLGVVDSKTNIRRVLFGVIRFIPENKKVQE